MLNLGPGWICQLDSTTGRILKTLYHKADILILDEATAVLTPQK